MTYAHIAGTGSCLPETILTNKDLEAIVDTSDEWIRRRTGIRQRRIALDRPEETSTMLGARAAAKALDMAGVDAADLDAIVVGTVSPDRFFPSLGCMIQKELRASRAAAFDISAGCSGFLYALESAVHKVQAGAGNVLVLGVERLSAVTNWNDRSTCVLLGDGAGAVVLQGRPEPGGVLTTCLQSDGSFWDLLYTEEGNDSPPPVAGMGPQKPYHMRMEGNRLFKQAVNCLSAIAVRALERCGLTADEVDLLVPHQANIRIIRAAAEKLSLPMERVYVNVDRYGNTSSASIPIALDEAVRAGRITPGNRILLAAFGAGLTWGSAVVQWSGPSCAP